MNSISREIERTLELYRTCWERLDFAGLRQLWDPDEPEPTYLAEESSSVLFGWEAIEEYWSATRAATRCIRIETWGLRTRLVAPGLATAVYEMRWVGEFAGYARPIGGDTRVTAIFRHVDGAWRFIHYVEAPLAPIAYFKRFYERFADAPPPRGGV
jgi:hypothetical protein